jgi:hypothetical protein
VVRAEQKRSDAGQAKMSVRHADKPEGARLMGWNLQQQADKSRQDRERRRATMLLRCKDIANRCYLAAGCLLV